ncbi:MAG: hypothetical protein MUD01_21985 [Chloroflexaceae bacterium]|jgi:chromosome segregation ATPase|nr:hypothetical protein [Chloroflexaceae bacterium]
MQRRYETYVHFPLSPQPTTPIQHVEVIDSSEAPAGDQQQFLGSAAEVLEALIQRFEQTVASKEQELLTLRATAEEAQAAADAYRHELETVNQICAMLERENHRLSAEVDSLRQKLQRAQPPERILEALLLSHEFGR